MYWVEDIEALIIEEEFRLLVHARILPYYLNILVYEQ